MLKENWNEKLENEANSWKDLFLFSERNYGSDLHSQTLVRCKKLDVEKVTVQIA